MFDFSDLTLQVASPGSPGPSAIPEGSIGISLIDGRRVFLQANGAFCDLVGYSADELIGMSVDEITHPDDRYLTDHAFRAFRFRKGGVQAYEKRYRRKDGSYVWSLTTISRLAPVAPGAEPCFVGFSQDISRQKEVEEKLRSTKNLYRSLVENIGAGLSLVDREHRILMVNARLARMCQKDPVDLPGKFCFREFENRNAPCPHCPGLEAMASGQPQTVCSQGSYPDGRSFKVRIKAFPVSNAEGAIIGFAELVEDLSDQFKMAKALQASEERFKALAEAAPIGIVEVDPQGQLSYANPAWVRMTGLSPTQSPGCAWTAAVPAAERRAIEASWQMAQYSGALWEKEHRLRHRNGEERWVQGSFVPVCDGRGRLQRYVGTIVDLTGQKKAMQMLAESEQRFRSIYEESGVGMKVITREGWILDANPAFCTFVGHSVEELKSLNIRSLVHPEESGRIDEALSSLHQQQSRGAVERRFVRQDGATVWGEVSGIWVPGGQDGQGFGVSIVQDVTGRKEAQARLEYLAYFDELTGLPNQKLLKDRLTHAIERSRRRELKVGVLLVGLDRFSKIIGSFDHETGNEVLCTVVQRLREETRLADTLSRLGDTEFVILLEDARSLKPTRVVAQNLLRKMAEPFTVKGQTLHLSASLGISLFPEDGETPEELLQAASAAMNRAKQQGGDLFEYFIPQLNERTREQLSLEAELRRALANEEFLLHYQPQVALQSRSPVGFEALLRWRHPERGLVFPDGFIASLEETGVIVSLGEWILRQACLQNMAWQKAGLAPVRMAVNISPRQFRRLDLPAVIRRVLQETEHPPELLELEITENIIMDDVEGAIGIMKEITAMGVHLAIDDFGSGYSSLYYLKRFPVKRLKVDRSFVRDVLNDANDAAIASAVVALAKTMNLEVVAEGIETEAQLDFFLEGGCGFGQGYLFGRPLPAERARELLLRPA